MLLSENTMSRIRAKLEELRKPEAEERKNAFTESTGAYFQALIVNNDVIELLRRLNKDVRFLANNTGEKIALLNHTGIIRGSDQVNYLLLTARGLAAGLPKGGDNQTPINLDITPISALSYAVSLYDARLKQGEATTTEEIRAEVETGLIKLL